MWREHPPASSGHGALAWLWAAPLGVVSATVLGQAGAGQGACTPGVALREVKQPSQDHTALWALFYSPAQAPCSPLSLWPGQEGLCLESGSVSPSQVY